MITATTFDHNRAGVGGGGLAAADTKVVLTDDTFFANATPGSGGAVSSPIAASILFLNDTITGNTAGVQGGGVSLTSTAIFPCSFQNTIVALTPPPSAPTCSPPSGSSSPITAAT